ncbi:MAG: hypothetical protein ACKV19_23935 [Verrucomicrobiales bacterium]
MGVRTSASPYYPPRAGGLGGWRRLWYRWRRNTLLVRLAVEGAHNASRQLPPWLRTRRLPLWMLVPGTHEIARGRRLTGCVIRGVWLGLLAVAVAAVGTPWGTCAWLAAAAVHSVSATSMWIEGYSELPSSSRRWRAFRRASWVVLLLYVLVAPSLAWMVVRPVTVRGTTVLINPTVAASSLRRGDWIVYHVTVKQLGFERVLAFAGETIRFHQDAFQVEDVAYRRLSHTMPEQGVVTVPPGMIYLWPVGARLGGGGDLTEQLRPLASVREQNVIGRAYERWPWGRAERSRLIKLDGWTSPGPDR